MVNTVQPAVVGKYFLVFHDSYNRCLFLGMRTISFAFFILISGAVLSQNFEQIKTRYDHYLNYKGSLDKMVEISPEKICFFHSVGGKKEVELTLKKSEWSSFATLCQNSSPDSIEKVIEKKIKEKDLFIIRSVSKVKPSCYDQEKPLCGKQVIIDPGHMAGNMKMARIEQKYLHFTRENYATLKQDSVDIAEGILTWQTASILKKMLEEKGASVVLTRGDNLSSFGVSYDDWFAKRRVPVLDSLLQKQKINAPRHKQLMKMNKGRFFIEFFKDFELLQRARVINSTSADLVIIIHYNVNEKNNPWIKPSDKDYCMAFVPGCLISDNLESTAGKANFLRLLLTEHLDNSEKVSGLLVAQLKKELDVPIAKPNDASYLEEHCISTGTAGVYCRNLALCRLVQKPLMYGECLYQDCETECYELIKNTEKKYGITTNKRVINAAQAYFNTVIEYYSK